MNTNELLLILLSLICAGCSLLGLVILNEKRFPLRGTKTVTGRDVLIIGFAWLIAGIIGFVVNMGAAISASQGRYTSNIFISSLAILIASLISYIFGSASRRVEIKKSKRKHEPLPDVLTVSEAARFLKVEEVYVLHLIEDGELKAKAIGGDYRISRDALQSYLDA